MGGESTKKTEEIKDVYLFGIYIGKSNEKLTPIEVLSRYRRGIDANMRQCEKDKHKQNNSKLYLCGIIKPFCIICGGEKENPESTVCKKCWDNAYA